MEVNKLLPNNTFGFRKGRSTHDYILKILEIIEHNKNLNHNTIAVDIQKAFDNVNVSKIA